MIGKRGRQLTVTGMVIVLDYDDDDTPAAFGIIDNDDEYFELDIGDAHYELSDYIDEEVTVEGGLVERSDGEHAIVLERLTLMH